MRFLKVKYCKFCLPTKIKGHPFRHLEYFFDFITFYLEKIISPKLFPIEDWAEQKLFQLLEFLGILKSAKQWDEKKFKNRSLIFFREARRRNLEIYSLEIFGKSTEYFKICYRRNEYFYKEIPLPIADHPKIDIDNKFELKKYLESFNLPVPEGRLFINQNKAITYAQQLNYPLVVKPNNGSLSCHSVFDIKTEDELRGAIKIVKKFRPDFIVEKFIPGDLFRATVIGHSKIFVCKKEKANIVGDGFSTIQDLIMTKNSGALRGDIGQKNCTLHKIPVNEETLAFIKNGNLTMHSILPKNKKLFLQNKKILGCGCDIIDCTNEIHEDNKELFLKIAEILETNLVGIDFICGDISKSYLEQQAAIIETNSLPYVDMHQYPSHGTAHPIAAIVWDIFEDKQ